MPVKTRSKNQRKTKRPVSIDEVNNTRSTKSTSPERTEKTSSNASSYYPSDFTAFRAILTVRLISALWNNISDCDETYNYWEPTHYLMFGNGFQTWEYSPQYALRSYAYLLSLYLPGWLYFNIFQPEKIIVFYVLRCLLGFFSAMCEAYFYAGLCREFGIHVGRLTFAFLVCSAGMFIASTAFLPSTFSMYMCLLSMGAWYRRKYELSIFTTALSSFLSWPFAGIIGLPIAIDILVRRKLIKLFITWCAISVAVILVPAVLFDSKLYGHLVVAPLNIVMYNVFSSHGANLYGTEPFTFYLFNGFLNFNFVFLAALVSGIAVTVVSKLVPQLRNSKSQLPQWLSLMPLYLWLAVFFCQAHKEERFLFPVYPLICVGGAITFDSIQKLWYHYFVPRKVEHFLQPTQWITILVLVVCCSLGISRIFALYKGYHAPLEVYMELNKQVSSGDLPSDRQVTLCVGKEWYRFPSHFFMPGDRWDIRFIESDFRGQLPRFYSDEANATSIIPPHMNDLNKEEITRYTDINKCHFLVDLDIPVESLREPRYSTATGDWKVVYSADFIHAERSHQILRAFYVPWLSEKYCTYIQYNLLVSTKFRWKKVD